VETAMFDRELVEVGVRVSEETFSKISLLNTHF
jgi:hypothetical protein